ncbi:lipid droplet-associated protein [Tsukamurella sp. 1534]|uniref:lipid droplet-associated protein n=1 Tax=Tsukamurella sp. 1534 TaxID=1151061 RepID=UPI000593A9D1|nr:lipid droplet-associated protein [Tsukamurella sp. 1534]
MSRLPFMVRVAAGAVSFAAEKGQEIVTGAVTAPVTLGSLSAQAFIRMQQDLADLAVRGDAAIETIFPAKEEEKAAWATFDDDEDVDLDLPDPPKAGFGDVRRAEAPAVPEPPRDAEDPAPAAAEDAPEQEAPSGAGRYALYSSPAPAPSPAGTATVEADADLPDAARRIDYTELTLAQLRGRLPGLSADDLRSLVEYERGHRSRAPFLTMLENRLHR